MPLGSFFKNLFHHAKDPKTVASALLAAKTTVDQLGALHKWNWLPQFDNEVNNAVTALNNWQPGQPTTQITQALNAAITIVNGVEGISQHDKAEIGIFIGVAESALVFLG